MGFFNKKELIKIDELNNEIFLLKEKIKKYEEIGVNSIIDVRKKLDKEKRNHEILLNKIEKLKLKQNEEQQLLNILTNKKLELIKENSEIKKSILESQIKFNKKYTSQLNKLQSVKELTKALTQNNKYETIDYDILKDAEALIPSVTVNLHCLDTKELRKKYKDNSKNIETILERYKSHYITKTNKTIYQLMVIALQAELQNILINMKYGKLEDALNLVKEVCCKYYSISIEGNKLIASKVQKFISEIEYLYNNAVQIEYEYYVRKEKEKQEQLVIKEKMKQEALEKKELENQNKKLKKEESKFVSEIENTKLQLLAEKEQTKIISLENKIKELTEQLTNIHQRKEEIIARQNGKAGYVYIISNIGSFGENVFKIGMTRRLDPMDRINELGSASVPFKFDVHAMIFSEDAPSLEKKLHNILNDKRVNKVNMRKEFFRVNIDELEEIVLQEDSTAEFTKTILSTEYNQSCQTN